MITGCSKNFQVHFVVQRYDAIYYLFGLIEKIIVEGVAKIRKIQFLRNFKIIFILFGFIFRKIIIQGVPSNF